MKRMEPNLRQPIESGDLLYDLVLAQQADEEELKNTFYQNQTLEDYLDRQVFAGQKADTVRPEPEDEKGFAAFMERYVRGLPLERCAVEYLK